MFHVKLQQWTAVISPVPAINHQLEPTSQLEQNWIEIISDIFEVLIYDWAESATYTMRNRWVQMKAVPFISIIRTHNTKERQNKHRAWWAGSKVEDAICASPLCNQGSLSVEEPSSQILLKYRKLQFRGDNCNHGNLTPLRSPISLTAADSLNALLWFQPKD